VAIPELSSVSKVLARYPIGIQTTHIASIADRGFSGAFVLHVESAGHSFCLRAWPSDRCDPARLQFIHGLMRRARIEGLSFVPLVLKATNGTDFVEFGQRLWEVLEWLPGRPDFQALPTSARLEAAASALARLHTTWEKESASAPGVCPALQRRLKAAAEWRHLRQSGWRPRWEEEIGLLREVAQRALSQVDRRIDEIPTTLQPWTDRRWPLHACHCDPWHDNLLFEGDRLSGLIDYGSVKIDHAAVDLARMLGSLVPDDPAGWRLGVQAYRAIRPFNENEVELALALDRTGAVIGAATWMRWLYEECRPFDDRERAAKRLLMLVERMEKMERV
jgi:homoserine kinase type II